MSAGGSHCHPTLVLFGVWPLALASGHGCVKLGLCGSRWHHRSRDQAVFDNWACPILETPDHFHGKYSRTQVGSPKQNQKGCRSGPDTSRSLFTASPSGPGLVVSFRWCCRQHSGTTVKRVSHFKVDQPKKDALFSPWPQGF